MTGTNDKIRGLFLTVLMVVSVFAGTIALTGTAAAANAPDVVQVEETSDIGGNGEIEISFNSSVRKGQGTGDIGGLWDDAEHIDVYVREAGTDNFIKYTGNDSANTSKAQVANLPDGNVEHNYGPGNPATVRISGAGTWGDLSPADEVLLNFGNGSSVAKSSDTGFGTSKADLQANETFDDNFTVSTVTHTITQGNTNHNDRSKALRVYQGESVSFQSTSDDEEVLMRNVETGEILLDGSTGQNSRSIAFDSENLESGTTYKLTFDEPGNSGGPDEQFINVTSLRLEATLEQDGTLFEHDDDQDIDITGSAVRGNADVAINIRNSTGTLNFTDTDRLDNRANLEYSRDDIGLNAGEYTVTVIDIETGVDVTAGEFTVDSFPEADSASFGATPAVDRGDVAEIPIQLQDSQEGALATVSIGHIDETNYVTNVTVADEDGDGEVVLRFNTFMAGINGSASTADQSKAARDRIFTAEGDDEVTSWRGENGSFVDNIGPGTGTYTLNSSAKNGTLDAASYRLSVAANEEGDDFDEYNFTDDGAEPDDVSTLNIRSRSTESSTVWVAPKGRLDDLDLDYINDNLDDNEDPVDGNLTQSNQAATDEIVVHQVQASGLEGVFRNRTDHGADNATVAFLEEVTNSTETGLYPAFNSSFTEANPGPNAPRESFELSTDNSVVVPDYENDTYYIAVRLDGVDESKLEDDQQWDARFGIEEYKSVGPTLGGSGAGEVESTWTFLEADASLETNDNNRVILRNIEDQTIAGDTNVAPGTQLEIEVESRADDGAFLERLDVRVQPDRTFEVTTDAFADKNAGINFTAEVRRDGNPISDTFNGRMLGTASAQISFVSQGVADSDNQEVTVDSVTLSDGGFVAIHEGSATGDIIGVSRKLSAGTHTNVRILLDEPIDGPTTLVAMPHLDANGNNVFDFPGRDGPYTGPNDNPVTDSANVRVITPTPTASPTPTPTATPTPTDTPSPTRTATFTPTDTPEPTTPTETDEPDTPEPTTTAEEGPGFGVVVAVLALLAAALLAARRRD